MTRAVTRWRLRDRSMANPMYREVLPRVLASGPQDSLQMMQPHWLTPEGTPAPDQLSASFDPSADHS